jgi:gentisate 1,2-dioxygenase
MKDLGTLNELPVDYVDALRSANLVPLWPALRTLLPPMEPRTTTLTTHWPWAAVRPLLLRAGELTPIEKAERRVLVLANPGRGLDTLQASSVIYLGMQLVLPGETAPNHRHTPNAARIVVEGEGACTIVGGERCAMQHGDLVLTPSGMWHEHRHEGSGPFMWLDVLDLPLMVYLDSSYVIQGSPQREVRGSAYASAGVVPRLHGERAGSRHPLLRFAWKQTREALEGLAGGAAGSERIEVAYVNPETGGDALDTIAFSAVMLRPGETQTLPRVSAARVFHIVEGAGRCAVDEHAIAFVQGDTVCVPGFARVALDNGASRAPLFLVVADESPVHRKLGIYETRG